MEEYSLRLQCPNCRNQTLKRTLDEDEINLECEHCDMMWLGYRKEYNEHP
jgi:ribosomal protein L37AE/L43A